MWNWWLSDIERKRFEHEIDPCCGCMWCDFTFWFFTYFPRTYKIIVKLWRVQWYWNWRQAWTRRRYYRKLKQVHISNENGE